MMRVKIVVALSKADLDVVWSLEVSKLGCS